MRVLAAAKINLDLRVGRRRADGFHPLASWMATVGLFDKLTFARARGDGREAGAPLVDLVVDGSDLSADSSNLVCRAAARVAEFAGRPLPTSVTLGKTIPIGAGLGGGSSDAARTLLAMDRLWELRLSRDDLRVLAASLGSDVSFFLDEPSAYCTGRGEVVRKVERPAARYAVLILPGFGMPTPAVYRRFDEMGLGTEPLARDLPVERTRFESQRLLEVLVNDLEAAAFSLEPKLGELRSDVEKLLKRIVRMSGSGSSLFTLFDEPEKADQAARVVRNEMRVNAIGVEVAPRMRDDLHENLGATAE
jgi:4-diphosphocytidyl-2-C-methyl-D-erythritol kinase